MIRGFLKLVTKWIAIRLGRRDRFLKQLSTIYRTNYWYSSIGKIGNDVKFLGRVFITAPHNLEIGDFCTINDGVIIVSRNKVVIGNRVRISPQVMIISGGLDYLTNSGSIKMHNSEPIIIGDDVWIASGAKILQGVSIGANSVIASGALVTSDVPPNSIARGIPARFILKNEKENTKTD